MKDKSLLTNILLNALSERYKSIHAIRDRIQNVTLWITGLLVAASAWLYQSGERLDEFDSITILVLILIIWFAIKKFYFEDLEKGFNSQRIVAAKIEETLGFYKKDYFQKNDVTYYPESWRKSGSKNGEGKFVENNLNLLALGFAMFALAIFRSIFLC